MTPAGPINNPAEEAPSQRQAPWAWWRSLGSPVRVLAPMVGQSELAYRVLCRRYGAELCVTPMVNAKMWCASAKYREDVAKDLSEARRPGSKIDRPLLVQLCGDDPECLVAAAKGVEDACDGVDLNLGCPQGIAKRGHYGAYLLTEPALVFQIVRALDSALTKIPVTCKIRLVEETDVASTLRLAATIVDAGASLLTIHGRTKEMKGHNVGPANWSAIERVASTVAQRIPVLANGGVERASDVDACLAAVPSVAGVMISEAALADPRVFLKVDKEIIPNTTTTSSKVDVALAYLDVVKRHARLETKVADARAHLHKLLYEILQADGNADRRDALCRAAGWDDLRACVAALAALPQVVVVPSLRRENNDNDDPADPTLSPESSESSTSARKTWYRRHPRPDDARATRSSSTDRLLDAVRSTHHKTLPASRNPYAVFDDDVDDDVDDGDDAAGSAAGLGSLFDES